jgi:hypothetical protein
MIHEDAPLGNDDTGLHGFNVRDVLDALNYANALHFTDGAMPIRNKIATLCDEATLTSNLISVAPVTFDRHWFDINEDATGRALVAPVTNEDGDIVDAAAFELAAPFRVKLLNGRGIALGLESIFDARHHPHYRVLCHSAIWSFLRSGCIGLLPIHWRHTVLHLHERGVGGLIAADADEGAAIAMKLAEALPRLGVFVQKTGEVA